MDDFYVAINKLQNQDIYLCPEPELLDFTKSGKLHVDSKYSSLEIPFSEKSLHFNEMLGILQLLGGENAIILTWKWHNVLSYILHRTKSSFKISGKIFDLQFLESYFGESNSAPKTFEEAITRLSKLIKKNNWNQVYKIYQKVYLPLIECIPALENYNLSYKNKKIKVYPNYEIDGQSNGRLRCSNPFRYSYNPHVLTPEDKENLCLPDLDHYFLHFDYKHQEVSVLQWLSQDAFMEEILIQKDFYTGVWEILTGASSSKEARQLCKSIFLPVFYGLGAEALSQRTKWPLDSCKKLINKLYKTFPEAIGWMKRQQNSVEETGVAIDYFGRIRAFETSYKARNFFVQSPASLICLHKLVLLNKVLNKRGSICMHIHDGYVLATHRRNVDEVYQVAKEVLEAQDELYPELRLKVDCKVGKRLDQLVPYKEKNEERHLQRVENN